MAKRRTVASVTIERAGYREGSKVLTVLMEWWVVHFELGHAPTVEEYADWWRVSRATGFRNLARFREVWPEVSDPSGLAAVLGLDLVNGEVKHAVTVEVGALFNGGTA